MLLHRARYYVETDPTYSINLWCYLKTPLLLRLLRPRCFDLVFVEQMPDERPMQTIERVLTTLISPCAHHSMQ